MSCVSHAFATVHCCLVVTCWERADLLALVGDVYSILFTFPCGILGQMWYLILSFPDLCHLSYCVVSYKRKYVHGVPVNCLVKFAQEKMWLGELTIAA